MRQLNALSENEKEERRLKPRSGGGRELLGVSAGDEMVNEGLRTQGTTNSCSLDPEFIEWHKT